MQIGRGLQGWQKLTILPAAKGPSTVTEITASHGRSTPALGRGYSRRCLRSSTRKGGMRTSVKSDPQACQRAALPACVSASH